MVGFFIQRPSFSSAIALIMVRAGQVVVSAVYPGASAQVVTETGTTPLEQQINGPDGGDRRHSALAIGLREG
jgi:hypothetical protein